MTHLLGIDTGGTYTDAVILDDATDTIINAAKSLTTRPDLALGIGRAIDAVLDAGTVCANDIALVSLSTTLATNALVEGHGGRIALILIGFDGVDLARGALADALGGDPALVVAGGHSHAGTPVTALDEAALRNGLTGLSGSVTGVAIAARFATRNPEHERAAQAIVREVLGCPVTCSHDLSQSLGGPKRALTAILNARLISLIDRLITATQTHMDNRGIDARLMVVRGDGALISADLARERPIETILSGPAASIAGAAWLTGARDAIVADIGGTTTDICVLRDGRPQIDPQGAKVGPFRTMVEAVAMRTFGLGGDSQVSMHDDLTSDLALGPRRVMPISLFALQYRDIAHRALDAALAQAAPPIEATRFLIAQWDDLPPDLNPRERAVCDRLADGPLRWADALRARVEESAIDRLIQRGLVQMVGVTPSDACHTLGLMNDWDADAATKALTLFGRLRIGGGGVLDQDPVALAGRILGRLRLQTVWALLETAFADEGWDDPAMLARHPLTMGGIGRHKNVTDLRTGLALPVIGLGASARTYYATLGETLGCDTILPDRGGVANAIGAVVGQIAIHADGTVTSAGEGSFRAHLSDGPTHFNDRDAALDALRAALTVAASTKARAAGIGDIRLTETCDIHEAQIEGRAMFVEATMRVTARGRPRIAS